MKKLWLILPLAAAALIEAAVWVRASAPKPKPAAPLVVWDSATERTLVLAALMQREHQPQNLFCHRQDCKIKHEVLGEYELPVPAGPRRLIVTASNDALNNCHACAPTLSFFEFEVRAGSWALTDSQFGGFEFGQFGEPYRDAIDVRPFGSSFALFLSGGSTHQGITEQFLNIVAPLKGKFQGIAQIQTGEENGGMVDPATTDWTANVTPDPKGGDYPDLIVTHSGLEDGAKTSKVERYRFNGTEYTQVE